MAKTYKPKGAKRPVARKNNQAKYNRKQFSQKNEKYKSDNQDAVCSAYHIPVTQTGVEPADSVVNIAPGDNFNITQVGKLQNATLLDNRDFTIAAVLALDPRNSMFHSPSYSAYCGLFNETRTSAIYLDLLLSKGLRDNANQIILLTEKGDSTLITDINKMVSDVNHKMYMVYDNTQKITFKHIASTINEKMFRKTNELLKDQGEITYLKILVKGRTNQGLAPGEAKIEIRSKCYNKFRDMKVLSAANIPLN